VLVVTQPGAAPIAARVAAALGADGWAVEVFQVPDGEAAKTLEVAAVLYRRGNALGLTRGDTIVAVGGGAVTDLAGFVAATYLRGVPFVQCPTSLLAMVDASIGGKVGVDHPRGKNLIGAFYAPRLVVQDTSLLAELPSRALREGFAEVIKHGLIMDPAMLDDLERDAKRLLSVEPDITTDMVARNAALKAKVVSEDEREGGLRAILNYGHTVGHAIENVTGYGPILHGEAISAGMMVAAEIGRRMGVTPAAVVERQQSLFKLYGLPLRHPGLDPAPVLAATRLDKKVAAKRLRWVLLEDVGRPVLRDDVDDAVALAVLSELFA
jgi:3-dehydroquinate synthase